MDITGFPLIRPMAMLARCPTTFLPIRRDGEEIVHGMGIKDLISKYTVLRLPPPANVLQAEVRRPSQVLDLTRFPRRNARDHVVDVVATTGGTYHSDFPQYHWPANFGHFRSSLAGDEFYLCRIGDGTCDPDRRADGRVTSVASCWTVASINGATFQHRADDDYPPDSVRRVVDRLYRSCFRRSRCVAPLGHSHNLDRTLFVTSEEDGMAFAMQLVVGTAVVAACCYLILGWKEIGDLLLTYPELHFFTIAAFIWIGRYSGYRLVELWRFRDMVK